LSLTVNVQPGDMLPPETGQVRVYGGSDRRVTLKEIDVSSVFQPDPVTVTVVRVGATLVESVTLGPPPNEKVLYADGGKPPPLSTLMM